MLNSPASSQFAALLRLRRSAVPVASAATALTLAGCGAFPIFGPFPQSVAVDPQARSVEQAAGKVREFTTNIDLDSVDQQRLQAAAQRRAAAVAPPAPSSAGSTATSVQLPITSYQLPTSPTYLTGGSSTFSVASYLAAHPVPPLTLSPSSPSTGVITAMAAQLGPPTPPEILAAAATRPGDPVVPDISEARETPDDTPLPPSATTVSGALAILRARASTHPTLGAALALTLLDPDSRPSDLGKSLPAPDQQVLSDLASALQMMTSAPAVPTTLADRAAPLIDAAKKWEADADLLLPRVVLASRVDSYGVFSPLEPRFEQGKKHTVILYCEVANYTAKKAADGFFETQLSQQATLLTEDGLLVWRPNAEDIQDRSLNQRRDFYLVKKLTLPDTLGAGKYFLRMSVTDRTSNKIALVTFPIEITK